MICNACNTINDPINIENIISSNYWPLTLKKINVVIDINLLHHINKIKQNMPGISEYSIFKSLEQTSYENSRVRMIYL